MEVSPSPRITGTNMNGTKMTNMNGTKMNGTNMPGNTMRAEDGGDPIATGY